MLSDVVRDAEGEKVFLLGNEAIARGAIEAGIDVFAAYPGTPSSEIADTLSNACRLLRGKMDFYMEYSANEKVAFEVAVGASLAGKRAMATMKHVGVNVAADTLFSFAYVGARGGFVLVTADDPSMHSSQNEQDNRWYGKAAKLPVVEPSSVQEAKDYAKLCFELSEKFGLPMILRSYTRLSHASGVVELGKIPEKEFERVGWERHPETDVVLPAHARKLKPILLEKLSKIEDYFNKSDMNWVDDGLGDVGVIACGLSYAYAKEALENLNLDLPVLKLSSMHPLPEKLIEDFVSQMKKVIVVEEVDPFVELHVRAMGLAEVYGKMNGYMPMNYEYNVGRVEMGIAKALGMKPSRDYERIAAESQKIAAKAPPRPPVLCPGCPHSASFYAIRRVVNELGNAALPSDIGCYTLGINKPLEGVDITICMGASVGVSNGLAHVLNDKIIATIGDSTFIHAGIPPLINAVYNNAKFVLVILDNSTTGMTGHQPHPGTGFRGCGEVGKAVKIEDIVKGCGVEFVEVVNPYNIRKMMDVLRRALNHDGVSVIIARQPCAILWSRARRKEGKIVTYNVTEDCTLCMECINTFACPALIFDGEKVSIDQSLCVGCAVCAKICPNRAIKPAKSN
ncbi:MAG: indolepyruvate ferredoxin oxidoreductase subunit alpha [Archaeoglobus sp.]|uniref:indolepyruvate ferredoxin oxidoreductase subunit alpha n=1 Tax=Archaeoglobus sp. TaxID=1872626 RepID=UPI001D6F5C61|nr:indolepyruvate ferredoxin oxidoreductase subunit alpha [Archaeoglobus sp.]MBO8180904.1 indolepyruvate ferredoxin oxidoreductase subunit alpha [Archaeoglobus sp.]